MTDLRAALLGDITPTSYDTAVAVAAAPHLVRGYEEVKLESLRRYITRLDELGSDTATLAL